MQLMSQKEKGGRGGAGENEPGKNAWRVNCHKFSKMYWRYGLKKPWKLKKNNYKEHQIQACHTQIVGNQREGENLKSQMKSTLCRDLFKW